MSATQPINILSLYERDFYAWTEEQAALLKAGRLADIDIAHLIEEVESLGASERRELYSRLIVLLTHLLKWRHQPGERCGNWAGTINEQRNQLELLLKTSPSLRRLLTEAANYAYPKARRAASLETGLSLETFPDVCLFTVEQALDENFWSD